MNILDKIVERKREELIEKKKTIPVESFKQAPYYNAVNRSLKTNFNNSSRNGIIAEFKRRSPSKGWFSKTESPIDIITSYDTYGASAISILTDTDFFGGTLQDLETARGKVNCPLLRKDFMIDPYQIYEAKAAGADIILLIAAILSPLQVKEFATEARQIGLEVLLEIHHESELGHICNEVDFVGVNNRDLKTFTVDIDESIRLSKLIPSHFIKISESGIDQVSTIELLKKEGFKGFLLGERFMKEPDPAKAFQLFTEELKMI